MQLGSIVIINSLVPFDVQIVVNENDEYYALDADRQIVIDTGSDVENQTEIVLRNLYQPKYGKMQYSEVGKPTTEITPSNIIGIIDASGDAPQ